MWRMNVSASIHSSSMSPVGCAAVRVRHSAARISRWKRTWSVLSA